MNEEDKVFFGKCFELIFSKLEKMDKQINDINIKADKGRIMMDKFAEKLLD